ncbi:MAG: TldD/PmbA family protein [Chloroflexota bacterium]
MNRLLDSIPAGVHGEVYHISAASRSVSFRAGELVQAAARMREGYALRVIADGRIGFATANTLEDPRRVVDKALASAAFGPQAAFRFPTHKQEPRRSVDERLMTIADADLADLGRHLVDKIKSYNSDFSVSAGVSVHRERVEVGNTAGGGGSTERTFIDVSGGGELVTGDDILNVYGGIVSGTRDIDVDRFADQTWGLVARAKAIVPAGAGVMPVLLTPKVLAGTVFTPLTAAFSGRSVLQRTSPLEDKVGSKPFDSRLNIEDNPLLDGGPAFAAIDDEGVAGDRIELIRAGVVSGFVWDLQTGGLASHASTGSGRKIGRTSGAGLNAQPVPGFSNTIVAPGSTPFWELVRSMKSGLIIDSVSGAPGFNPSGEFSVTIQVGYRVENGEIVGRVKNAMAAGNVFSMLNDIVDIGSEPQWLGGGEGGALSVPAMLFGGLRVVSK